MSSQIAIQDPISIWNTLPRFKEDRIPLNKAEISREAFPRFNPKKNPPLKVKKIIKYHNEYIQMANDRSSSDGRDQKVKLLYERVGVISLYLGEIFLLNSAPEISFEFIISAANCFINSGDFIRANYALQRIIREGNGTRISENIRFKIGLAERKIPQFKRREYDISREELFSLEFTLYRLFEVMNINDNKFINELYSTLLECVPIPKLVELGSKIIEEELKNKPNDFKLLRNKHYFQNMLNRQQKALETLNTIKKIDTGINPEDSYASNFFIGNIYLNEVKTFGKVDSIEPAIFHFRKALEFFVLTDYPREYSLIQINIAALYDSASYLKPEKQLYYFRDTKRACQEAKKGISAEDYPMYYSLILILLGSAYNNLLKVSKFRKKWKIYCEEAETLYKEALTLLDYDRNPRDYGMTLINLGNVYTSFSRSYSENVDRIEYAEKSILSLVRAREIFEEIEDKHYQGLANLNLGEPYVILGDLKKDSRNCKEAIKTSNKALEVFTIQYNKRMHAHALVMLGTAFSSLAQFENRDGNCKEAKKIFNEAIEIFGKTSQKSREIRNRFRKYCTG